MDRTGRCVDLELTRELHAHRPIGFGAPTANTSAVRTSTAVFGKIQGSTFGVWLPSAIPPGTDPSPLAARVERKGHVNAKPTVGPLSVLYVEDNEVNVTLMEAMAAMRPNVRLSVARSGAEAMSLITQVQPRAVLMDMHLGDCNGIELLEQLHAGHSEAKRTYVAVSADASADQISRALSHGFDRYLTKPLQLDTLLALLDELGSVTAG